MSERIEELLRQRQLIQEHLAWLDQEIAREDQSRPAATVAPRTAPTTTPSPTLAQPSGEPVRSEAEADAILSQYQHDPKNLAQDTRKGCLQMFFAGMAIFLGVVGIAYFLYARHLEARRAADPAPAAKHRPM